MAPGPRAPRFWAVVLAGWPVVGLKCSRCDGLLARAGRWCSQGRQRPCSLCFGPLPLPPPRRAGRGWPPATGRGPCAVAAWPLRPGARKAGRARQNEQRARRMGAVIGGSRSGAAAARPCRGPRLRPARLGASMPPPSLQCGPRPVRPSAAAGSRTARPRGVRARHGSRGSQARNAPESWRSPHAHRPLETSRRPRTHPCARGRAGALTGFPFSREIVKKITQLTDRRMV